MTFEEEIASIFLQKIIDQEDVKSSDADSEEIDDDATAVAQTVYAYVTAMMKAKQDYEHILRENATKAADWEHK